MPRVKSNPNCKGKFLDGHGIAFEEKVQSLFYIGDGIYECDVEGCGRKFTLSEELLEWK